MDTPDPALQTTYEATDYRVRLTRGGHASIRVGQPLPSVLLDLLPHDGAAWAVITAWNPRSASQPRAINRAAQRRLLSALGSLPGVSVRAAIGVGTDRWREPSLFACGITSPALAALMRRFDQHAVVTGYGAGPARLLWNPPSRADEGRDGMSHMDSNPGA